MSQYEEENVDMILRDYLALDRTKLANERTMLSYIRTFVGLVASGAAILKFFDHGWLEIIGYVFIVASFAFLSMGIVSYFDNKRALGLLIKKSDTGLNKPRVKESE